MGGSRVLTRPEQIREELANIEAQLLYTKTQILIDNCKRTKQILKDELKTITGSRNEIWSPNDQKDNNHR